MRTTFGDPRQREKALARLSSIRQGSQALETYIVDFDQLLLEAYVWDWDSRTKKAHLRAGLAIPILERLVGQPEPDSYIEYCNHLRAVQDDLTALQARQRTKQRPTGLWKRQQSPVTTPEDAMDWQAAPVSSSRTGTQGKTNLQAKWVSREELLRRQGEGLCIRCGRKGHFIADCQQAPARRPGSQQALTRPKDARAAPVRPGKRPKKGEAESETDNGPITDLSEEEGSENE